MVEAKSFLANKKQAISLCDLGARGCIVGEHGFRRWCNRGHEWWDSGDGEVHGGSDGQREVTIESSSFIGVNGNSIGIEFALCAFNGQIRRLRRAGANGSQRGRWEVRLKGAFTRHGGSESA